MTGKISLASILRKRVKGGRWNKLKQDRMNCELWLLIIKSILLKAVIPYSTKSIAIFEIRRNIYGFIAEHNWVCCILFRISWSRIATSWRIQHMNKLERANKQNQHRRITNLSLNHSSGSMLWRMCKIHLPLSPLKIKALMLDLKQL